MNSVIPIYLWRQIVLKEKLEAAEAGSDNLTEINKTLFIRIRTRSSNSLRNLTIPNY